MSRRTVRSTLLYLISCSNAKVGGGESTYGADCCIGSLLTPLSRNYLIDCRRAIYDHIKQGGGTRQGKRLRELPYNKTLRKSGDFLGSEEGLFLPARLRYAGRLYSEIPVPAWEERRHHVVIISGLYGLILPEESIQRYSLDLKDSAIVYDMWKDALTLLVGEFIKRKRISRIIDGIGEDKYRNVIDWDYIRGLADTTHILGSQNAGPAVLRAVGEFLGKMGFMADEEDLIKLFRSGKGYPTRFEMVHFLSNLADAKAQGLPVEEAIETQRNALSIAVPDETPRELIDVSEGRAYKVEISYRALDEWKELPARIASKVAKTLDQFITNPRYPGLRAEIVNTKMGALTRIRINDSYRIHLLPGRDSLTVLAIGPHRLMGIG